jgi:hypothetical protein
MEGFLVIFALFCVAVVFLLQSKGTGGSKAAKKTPSWVSIRDNFKTLTEVQTALRGAGLESSQLIIGVDFTQSNEWQGQRTFGGRNLHDIKSGKNPYEAVLETIGQTLSVFDEDGQIPTFGFGDSNTRDHSVFSFNPSGADCDGLSEVLERYRKMVPSVQLSGPTSFAPLIRKAIKLVKEAKEYHILLIIADGQVAKEADTVKAIVEASQHPLSIVMVGVGDGPWDMMDEFDDKLPQRAFDNFQFVEYTKYAQNPAAFALNALMEIPEQFQEIRKLNLL